jgi:hypothetical protein
MAVVLQMSDSGATGSGSTSTGSTVLKQITPSMRTKSGGFSYYGAPTSKYLGAIINPKTATSTSSLMDDYTTWHN